MQEFYSRLTPEQTIIFKRLINPAAIQAYLDSLVYIAEERDRSPLAVIQDGQCHCLDGGLLAAVALRQIGYEPLVVDLIPEAGFDDDHVLAIFKIYGCYGAVAKSNFVGLRYREPVFRTLRELVKSYFEFFFNLDGVKTLRAYTLPVNLKRFDYLNWMWDEKGVAIFSSHFYNQKPIPLFTSDQLTGFSLVDPWTLAGATWGTNVTQTYGSR